jgi:hypothetical protein
MAIPQGELQEAGGLMIINPKHMPGGQKNGMSRSCK